MRKTQATEQEINGDFEKYESYREAWARIKQAQENDFFLEAITIQESIISDRLISFLSRPGASNSFINNPKKRKFTSLGLLIAAWREEFPNGLKYPKIINEDLKIMSDDLIGEIDSWRFSRNDAIHAIVKSEPGTATQPIDEFLQIAKEVAERGTELTKAVCMWRKSKKREQNSKPAPI
jgi:hypothetical protein